MKKLIVTLRGTGRVEVDVPEGVKERTVYGALRLFQNVPKTLSEAELKVVREKFPAAKLQVQRYVESKRVGRRAFTEAEVQASADGAGEGHLPFAEKLNRHAGRLATEAKKVAKAVGGDAPAGDAVEAPAGGGGRRGRRR